MALRTSDDEDKKLDFVFMFVFVAFEGPEQDTASQDTESDDVRVKSCVVTPQTDSWPGAARSASRLGLILHPALLNISLFLVYL